MIEDSLTQKPRSSPVRAIFLAMLLAFVCGLAVMAWAFSHWFSSAAPTPAPVAKSSQTAPIAQPVILAPAPALSLTDAHVAALEARLNEIDKHAEISAAQAAHAENLLIAFAVRRSVDRGVGLGYLEGQLNSHFGATQPVAVANIIAASQSPVTLDQLRAGLDDEMPELDSTTAKADWWTRLRLNMSGLITIRKVGQPSTAPDERLARARLALNTGAVANALAEVSRLPIGTGTQRWMDQARRYIAAHNALDVIEAAALTLPTATTALAKPAK